MKSIDQIFIEHETDKSSKSHNYSPYYEMLFAPYRDLPINLLEIGVYAGASMRAWKEYFSVANIFGVDLTYMPNQNSERIFMIQADQSNKEDRARLAEVKYDIIIDDASHVGVDQYDTFMDLFPSMNSGGIYVIEDILCSYDERWSKPFDIKELLRLLPDYVNMKGTVPNSRICANKHEAVKLYQAPDYFSQNIEFVLMAMGICFIKKI